MPQQRWWSSRPGAINWCCPEKPIVGICAGFGEEEQRFKPGWRSGFALPLATARAIVTLFCPDWELACKWDGDLTWEPRLRGHGFKDQDGKPYYAMKHTKGQLRRN
jgi:hypothetical protein